MGVFILIGILIGLFLCLVLFIKHKLFMDNLYWHFKHCNCIVYGKKGSGKDLVTDKVIHHRNDHYYANIPYSCEKWHEIATLSEVSCAPNDYKALVTNEIKKTPHKFYEGVDIYLSDMGVYLLHIWIVFYINSILLCRCFTH